MKTAVSEDIQDLIEAVHYRPSITILLPLTARIGMHAEMQQQLKRLTDKVQKKLTAEYPDEVVTAMMHKLAAVVSKIDFTKREKSIALYISPVFSKLLYLDLPVEEKLIIDEVFELRDLLYSKKQVNKYLVLLLGTGMVNIYLVDTGNWIVIPSDRFTFPDTSDREVHEQVANFSDPATLHETETRKFLQHTDKILKEILDTYHLPVFVMGNERILGHFRKIAHDPDYIAAYIPGDHHREDTLHLQKLINPYISQRHAALQHQLQVRLNDAADKKILSAGIKEVWQEAVKKNAGLLVVEKNYMFYSSQVQDGMHARDKVDEVIRLVLESGGDVMFADPDTLEEYNHIALIRYY